jgi:hypothetical protein
MNIQVKPVKVYEIFANNDSIGLFKQESQWEGFQKLKSLKDENFLIITDKIPNSFSDLFNNIFVDLSIGLNIQEFTVVAASPDLYSILTGKTE